MRAGASIAGRVLRGSAALSLVAVVNVVGQLVTMPVAMRFWGPEHFGEWVVLSGAVTFLALADLGIQTHVVNVMTAHHARGDIPGLLAALHSALRLQLLFVGVAGGVIATALVTLPTERWLDIHTTSTFDVRLTLGLLGLEVLLSVPSGIIGGTYRATGHLVRAAFITGVQRVAFFAFPLLAMALRTDFAMVAFARVGIGLAAAAWLVRDLRRLHPWWRLAPLGGSLGEGVRMLGPGLLFVLLVLADYLTQQGAVFILQRAAGPDTVSQFVTHRTAVNMARMASGMLTAAAWMELTALEARAEVTSLQRAHRSLARVNAWLVGAVTLLLIPLAQFLYGVWTLKKLQLDATTLALLAAQTVLWGAWASSGTVLRATNRQGQMAIVLLATSGLGVLLAALLTPSLGMRGCALGSLLADVLVAAWLTPVLAAGAIGERISAFFRTVGSFFVLGVALPLIAAYAVWRLLPSATVAAVVAPILGLVGTGVLGWRNLEAEERSYVLGVWSAVRRRVIS